MFHCRDDGAEILTSLLIADQAEYLLHSGDHVLFGIVMIHSLLQTYYAAQDREEGIDTSFVAGDSIFGHATGESQNQLALLLGDAGYTDGSLAHNGLSVQAAFAGDNEISIFYMLFQMGFLKNDRNS